MTFVSVPFLILLLAADLLYYLFPLRHRWLVLLAASLVFYAVNSGLLTLVLVATAALVYAGGRMIHARLFSYKTLLEQEPSLTKEEKKSARDRSKKQAKQVLTLFVLVILGILLFLKYSNFFAGTAVSLFTGGKGVYSPMKLLLPLGISFYTLQAISYLVDISRGKADPEKDPLRLLLYLCFFPQIVQGPIPRYRDLGPQLAEGHPFDPDGFCRGLQLILWGFMKKLIIADRIATPVSAIFSAPENYSGVMAFLGAAFYGIQVYADFSGGMDIALGAAQTFGITLTPNFTQPYFSTSVEDFWRRWHITLGAWMKDYIFYPLSLSKAFGSLSQKARKLVGPSLGKKLPSILAMFIVYFLVGIWHGPQWTYILYGIWNGIFIVGGLLLPDLYEKGRRLFRIDEDSASWRVFRMIRTFWIISVGRFFSRAKDTATAFAMIGSMFHNWYDLSPLSNGALLGLGLEGPDWIVLAVAVLVLLYTDNLHEKGVKIRESISRQPLIFRWLIYYIAILLVLIFGIYGPGYVSGNFIYEQF